MSLNLDQDFSYTKQILSNYPREKRFALAILQDIQKHYNYIPKESLEMVQAYLDIPLSKLYGIATFYKALSLKPKGRHIIKVCDGTACHIKASQTLLEEIKEQLNILPGETTDDGMFSLETVNCLGSCAVSPVMVIDDNFYGNLTRQRVALILKEYGGDPEK